MIVKFHFHIMTEEKVWNLDYLQSVSANSDGTVQFHHTSWHNGSKASLFLSREQFYNFSDVILNWENYKQIENIPIGKHVWFYNKRQTKHLYNSHTRMYFTFFYQSWLQYKTTTHYLIVQLLRYQWNSNDRIQNRQHHAQQSTAFPYQSRSDKHAHTKDKVFKRSTENACSTLGKRTKYSTVSKRENTSVGRAVRFCGAANENRAANEVAPDSGEDADSESSSTSVFDSGLENIEYCSID